MILARTTTRTAAAVAAASLLLAACGPAGETPTDSPTTGPSAAPTETSSPTDTPGTAGPTTATPTTPAPEDVLIVGVPTDHPGLGVVLGTGPYGFEPALAEAIAEYLGMEVSLVPLDLDQRVRALKDGQVEMVLASLAMPSSTEIDLAGPYLVVHQDMLLAPGHSEWRGETLCGVQGTPGLTRAQRLYADDTLIYPAETYSGCVEMLANGTVTVVVGDDVVLAGFAAKNPGRMSLAGESLATTRYRVGLPLGSTELCEDVNEALAALIEDGTWAELAETHLGPGYVPDAALNPPTPEACAPAPEG